MLHVTKSNLIRQVQIMLNNTEKKFFLLGCKMVVFGVFI